MFGSSWADSLQQAKDAASGKLREAREQAEQQAKALSEAAESKAKALAEQAEQQAKAIQETAASFESNMLFPGEEPPPPRRTRAPAAGMVATPRMMDSPDKDGGDDELRTLRAAIVMCLPTDAEPPESAEALAASLQREIDRLRHAGERPPPGAGADQEIELEFAKSQVAQLQAKLQAAGDGEAVGER
eukprot:4435880-Prymnesium_polylepis.1